MSIRRLMLVACLLVLSGCGAANVTMAQPPTVPPTLTVAPPTASPVPSATPSPTPRTFASPCASLIGARFAQRPRPTSTPTDGRYGRPEGVLTFTATTYRWSRMDLTIEQRYTCHGSQIHGADQETGVLDPTLEQLLWDGDTNPYWRRP